MKKVYYTLLHKQFGTYLKNPNSVLNIEGVIPQYVAPFSGLHDSEYIKNKKNILKLKKWIEQHEPVDVIKVTLITEKI